MRILDQLLKAEIAQEAKNQALATSNDIASAQNYRFNYILKVLNANNSFGRPDWPLITAVRDAALTDSHPFAGQLAGILTAYLSPKFRGDGTPNGNYAATQARIAFISAFTRRSQNAIGALTYIAHQNAWGWNRFPPPGPSHYAD